MRVLVVDDDPLIRWSLEWVLSQEGYQVSALDSAEKALAEVEASPCHVAIVEVVLPGMDGLELIGKMRTNWPSIKTMVITGKGSRDVERRAMDQGVFA